MGNRIDELTPGDLVTNAGVGMFAVFIARTTHPIWPQLQLVIWRLDDGSWSHDALDARQEVGEISPSNEADRSTRLRKALLDGPT
jgi:hypothetical protein